MASPSFYIGHSGAINPHGFFKSIVLAALEFRHTIMHYSGFLGAQNHLWPPKLYFVTYTFLVFVFFLIGFKNFFKKYQILSFYLFSAGLFLFALSFYFKKAGFSWDIQGRFFLFSFFPFYFFVYLGIKKIFPVFLPLAKILKTFVVINFFLIVFFLIIPNYYSLKTIIVDLNTLYFGFGYLFLIAIGLFFYNMISYNR